MRNGVAMICTHSRDEADGLQDKREDHFADEADDLQDKSGSLRVMKRIVYVTKGEEGERARPFLMHISKNFMHK